MKNAMNRREFLKTSSVLGAAAGIAGAGTCLPAAAETDRRSSASKQLGWRLGCCAYSFNWLTFHETIGKVASLGLKEIVGWDDPEARPA